MESRHSRIEKTLKEALSVQTLFIEDESRFHAGRAGTESHFKVYLVSTEFEGLSRVERSQKVHQLLSGELKNGLHALSLRLLTAQEAALSPPESFVSPECIGRRP